MSIKKQVDSQEERAFAEMADSHETRFFLDFKEKKIYYEASPQQFD